MSRIPQPSSSRLGIKPSTPLKSRTAVTPTPSRVRTQSTTRATPLKSKPPPVPESPSKSTSVSIKEAIALRRAEAKKAQSQNGSGFDSMGTLEDALPTSQAKQEDEDVLGRWPVKETIERARSTGILNIATRSLQCLPSALFEIHLGITPEALKSVPNEPPLPSSTPDLPARRRGQGDSPAWFEAKDLQVLKAWNNDITEIQHEISLFGSLKTVDLHRNKLQSLPTTFGDLSSLTILDLSHNALKTLPANLFTLAELTTLNISHNALTSLPFSSPFDSKDGFTVSSQYSTSQFFTPAVNRSSKPLPKLVLLDASFNKISAAAIDISLPSSLTKLDLSANPLGSCQPLLRALGALERLREARFEKAEIDDSSFPPSLYSSVPFPNIRLLDFGETAVSQETAKAALASMKQDITFDYTADDPPPGVTRVLVGKKVIKEAWELELERREKERAAKGEEVGIEWGKPLLGPASTTRTVTKPSKAEVVKEAWEIEAEQGLMTEGGKRRARAAAAMNNSKKPALEERHPTTTSRPPSSASGQSLVNLQYYNETTQTLKLPPSAPPSKMAGHARAFSLAVPSTSAIMSSSTTDLAVPAPTLPLFVIVNQPFADTLKTLILVNRRMDRSFSLPPGGESFLPKLEELDLEGCNLADLVTVHISSEASGVSTPPRSNEPILPLIARLFPSLRTLNLSYNALTNSAFTYEALSSLILVSEGRKGLRHLRLRGNKLSELDGFQQLASAFKGNREVPDWKLEELDIRDMEIGKLPPELGLLPLDVFLVDGNTFRVPQRRVWEREGTKGLLSWLRGRIE